MQVQKIVAVIFVLLFVGSCKPPKKDEFNRTALLENLYGNITLPAFQHFEASANALKLSVDQFLLSTHADNLDSLKTNFLKAYLAFQAVEAYTFSPSMDLSIALNSFPPDTAQIISNINSGTYDLSTANNVRAKGFPALDFLLFNADANETLLAFSATGRKQYLMDVVTELQMKATNSADGWAAFQSTFVSASGIDLGSSVGMLVNDWSAGMEKNRRERVGNSLGYVGVISGGVIQPTSMEAFYSGKSKELLIENLNRMKDVYAGGSGVGFDDYLEFVGADYNGSPLSSEISLQFDKAILAAENVPVAFSDAVSTHNAEMQTLFLELKKLTVLLKVDMSSNLGVVINYSDNDGD